MGTDAMEVQGQPLRGLRDVQDLQATGRNQDQPQDLVLAVCLSVLITFIVAFCVGVFTRPYVDKLWLHCRNKRNKSRASDNTYINEGFRSGAEAAQNMQHPGVDVRQAPQYPSLYENQDPYLATPYATVILDRNSGTSKKEPGSQQSSEPLRGKQRTGSRNGRVLSNGSAAHSALHRQSNTDNSELHSAARDHIYRDGTLEELKYENVTPEHFLSEHSVGISSVDDTLQTLSTFSGSTCDDMNELDASLPRETTASIPQMLTHTSTLSSGDCKKVGGSQMECSKGTQVSHSNSFLGVQQPGLLWAGPNRELPALGNMVTHTDAGHMDPSSHPPGWGGGLNATAEWLVQKNDPSYPRSNVESDYDSDEGSLFTLSSEGSESTRDVIAEEIHGEEESCGATKPLQGENIMAYKVNVIPIESTEENIPCQKIPGKHKTQEGGFENLISSPSDEIPGMLIQPEPVQWFYSLKDL